MNLDRIKNNEKNIRQMLKTPFHKQTSIMLTDWKKVANEILH